MSGDFSLGPKYIASVFQAHLCVKDVCRTFPTEALGLCVVAVSTDCTHGIYGCRTIPSKDLEEPDEYLLNEDIPGDVLGNEIFSRS
ncbi:hypothetical protein BT96DRAFT_1000623 [Gymnopus androsaceus JB14]|uniref:Uncharacterized protein n=1 Tax=Gymnopus androsaceus JB14 TaxID=1447944 RepID=A0A6A4H370_9AGAR|nr:hypothetical protein BT96DRAFT_1000623 [Gymnopus androsaceus JB14]